MPNHAPRFQWKRDPAGRVALVAALCLCHHLGLSDDVVCFGGRFLKKAQLEFLFTRTMPWFPGYYNAVRENRADLIGYHGRLEPFNTGDLYDRLAYMFHMSAISDEHPKSVEQARPGKLRETWVASAALVMQRIVEGKAIELEEALVWGRPSPRKFVRQPTIRRK